MKDCIGFVIYLIANVLVFTVVRGSARGPSKSIYEENFRRHLELSLVSSRVYLNCPSLEDEAENICISHDRYQRTSISTRAIVTSSELGRDRSLAGRSLDGQLPRIYTWTSKMIAIMGDQTKLICRADGNPRPNIRWFGINGEVLAKSDTNKYEISSNGDLIIRNIEWSDRGMYTCVAENVHGDSKVEAYLYASANVLSSDNSKQPDHDKNNTWKNLELSLTSSRLYLDCHSLEDDSKNSCIAEEPWTSITTRVIDTPADLGRARSLHGEDLRGQRPVIYTSTKSVIANQGRHTRLVCRAHGYPRPTITWFNYSGEKLKANGKKLEILSNGDLIIRNLEWSDLDLYTCVAENVHGKTRAEIFVYPSVPEPVKR